MAAHILDGKALSQKRRAALKTQVTNASTNGSPTPGLAVLLVGDHTPSKLYVANKEKACHAVGIYSEVIERPETLEESALLEEIETLNRREDIHGILVQLPLPEHINPRKVIEAIAPHKDVDGFHPVNLGRLAARAPTLRPCTPYGIMTLLEHYDCLHRGDHAVVVGASNIVGRPLSLEFLLAGLTVTTCHRFTKDLEHHVKQADVLVAAVGKPDIIHPDWVKSGSVVVDVGISRTAEGQIRGDLDFEKVREKASWLTPVPGGVGPMTITMLVENTAQAAWQS